MSEGILRHLLKEKDILHKWKIDSAGLANWHAGKPPDEFTIEMLQRNNMLGDYTHKARQITYDDFMKFHFILTMDEYNLRQLSRMTPPGCVAKIQLLGSYDLPGEESEIYDPFMVASISEWLEHQAAMMKHTQRDSFVVYLCPNEIHKSNTCRSTMAEAILRHLVREKGIEDDWAIDSAGTGNRQTGQPPSENTTEVLRRNNMLGDYDHKARQISFEDFWNYKMILVMDKQNLVKVKEMSPMECSPVIKLLGEYDSTEESKEIQDPYGANIEVFEEVYEKCLRCCKRYLESQLNLTE